MKFSHLIKIIPISLLFLSACGGGGEAEAPVVVIPDPIIPDPIVIDPPPDEEIIGLQMPDIISIVNDGSTPPVIPAQISKSNTSTPTSFAFDDPASDYTNDVVRTYVWDESMGPMQMVNEILCFVGQTRASDLVNQTYTALIDVNRCSRNSEGGGNEQGQSSGSNDTEYQLWTIESTRESADAAQRVRIWVPSEEMTGDDPMDRQNILVDVTINSSPDDALPFGDFNMNWKGVLDVDGNEISSMQGTIQTVANAEGKLQFIFYNGADMPEMGVSFSEAANVILDDADGNSGIGKTATHHSDPFFEFTSEFSVAYDPTRFLRGKDENNDGSPDSQMCHDRVNLDENVWRYNLYREQDGSRVNLNSGFPFTTNLNSVQYNGFISYWGLWLPDNIDASSVTLITRQDFGDSANNADYNLVHTPGKLIKRTKSTIPLTTLDGASFSYWFDAEYMVEYTVDSVLKSGIGVESAGFFKIATIEFVDNQRVITPVDPELMTDQFLHFYSENLGGSVAYDSIADPLHVVVFGEEFVSGNDSELFDSNGVATLDCYNDCLKANLTTAQLQMNGETPYLENSQDASVPAATYTFNLNDFTLRDATGNPIAMASGQSVSADGQFSWGIHSGAMVLAGTQLDNPWDTWNQEVSYQWETGPNNWNKLTFARLVGQQDFVQFDRPMQFLYTHSGANDRNLADGESGQYNGESLSLQYGGQGDLWGIPHEETDNGRYQPAFSLKDSTALSNQNGSYVTKAVEIEKRMRELDLETCTQGESSLSLTDAIEISLPTANDVTPITFGLSDKPVVTDAPRVVGGEIVN